jgi:hypothetical protein
MKAVELMTWSWIERLSRYLLKYKLAYVSHMHNRFLWPKQATSTFASPPSSQITGYTALEPHNSTGTHIVWGNVINKHSEGAATVEGVCNMFKDAISIPKFSWPQTHEVLPLSIFKQINWNGVIRHILYAPPHLSVLILPELSGWWGIHYYVGNLGLIQNENPL